VCLILLLKHRFDWPAVKVYVAVKKGDVATVPIELDVDMQCGGNIFNVMVDGQVVEALTTDKERRIYTITPSTAQDEITVIGLVKRTEPQNGTILRDLEEVTIYGFSVRGGYFIPMSDMVGEEHHAERRIEFVGDSDSTAFGNMFRKTGVLGGFCHMSPHAQNVHNGFTCLLERGFSADADVIAFSGIGVTQCAFGTPGETMIKRYPRCLAADKSTDKSAGDFNPHLVVVHIGANDYLGGKFAPKDEDFVEEYLNLLNMIRARHPASKILCLVMAPDAITGSEYMSDSIKVSTSLHANTNEAVRRFLELEEATSPRTPLKEVSEESPSEGDNLMTADALLGPLSRACQASVEHLGQSDMEANPIDVGVEEYVPSIRSLLLEPKEMDPDTDFALILHWSQSGHKKVATAIAEEIEGFMGWKVDMEAMVGVTEYPLKGPQPSCCWKGTCAGDGKCYCAIM